MNIQNHKGKAKAYQVRQVLLEIEKLGSPYKAVQVIKKHVIISINVLILLGYGFGVIDVTY